MKQYLYIAAFSLAALTTYAQQDLNTAADAVRMSQDNLTGTARFRAMSGAFGALGGDLSAININPAGSAIFNYNSATASLSSYNTHNKAGYFGSTAEKNDNAFDLNQLGVVFVFNNTNEEAAWRKFAIAINYENNNSFDNSIFAAGISPNSNLSQYFLRYANGIGDEGGITLNTLNNAYFEDLNFIDQQAYLGYNGYIFNPVENVPGNTAYVPNVPAGNNYHENALVTTGYNGKVAFNIAGQLQERLYLGLNLNVHFTDYLKTSSYYEEFNGAGATDLQWAEFNNERYTYGGGFSFNLGGIVKITDEFKLGLAYESPIWYRLQDEIRQNIVVNNGGDVIVTDPGLVMIMDDYSLKTPGKYTGSLAYVFGTKGLISIDYSLKDYANAKFSNNRYNTINDELDNTLDMVSEVRVGAEYRIKSVSLRGGYRFEQSPYKNGKTISDLNGITGGIGFTFNNSRLDLAYSWYRREMNLPMIAPGLSDAARVNTNNNNVTLSYTIDL
jgi:hypothetical protein